LIGPEVHPASGAFAGPPRAVVSVSESSGERTGMTNSVIRPQNYSGLKHHAKVHSFRMVTAILAWVLIGLAFYYRPELLSVALRTLQRSIEALGDALPYPWGPRIEVLFKELGGFIWLQITLIIIVVRVVFSTIAAGWRYTRRRDSK
jgi:hypothetical protein